MRRLLAQLAGLFVPRPDPKKQLTPPRVFKREEEALKYLNDELAAIRADKRR